MLFVNEALSFQEETTCGLPIKGFHYNGVTIKGSYAKLLIVIPGL
jgi:hypothetical protein